MSSNNNQIVTNVVADEPEKPRLQLIHVRGAKVFEIPCNMSNGSFISILRVAFAEDVQTAMNAFFHVYGGKCLDEPDTDEITYAIVATDAPAKSVMIAVSAFQEYSDSRHHSEYQIEDYMSLSDAFLNYDFDYDHQWMIDRDVREASNEHISVGRKMIRLACDEIIRLSLHTKHIATEVGLENTVEMERTLNAVEDAAKLTALVAQSIRYGTNYVR